VLLHILDELPHRCTTLRVLEGQCIIHPTRLCPYNKSVLLPLVDILAADGGGEDDGLEVSLGAGDDGCVPSRVVVVTQTECGALVNPALADELVDLNKKVKLV
jgi:hypothetical protein